MLRRIEDDEPDLRTGLLALGAEHRADVARATWHETRSDLGQSDRESLEAECA